MQPCNSQFSIQHLASRVVTARPGIFSFDGHTHTKSTPCSLSLPFSRPSYHFRTKRTNERQTHISRTDRCQEGNFKLIGSFRAFVRSSEKKNQSNWTSGSRVWRVSNLAGIIKLSPTSFRGFQALKLGRLIQRTNVVKGDSGAMTFRHTNFR
ncbi:uncharacterized protein LOC126610678 [Malus sylvestris]|uniref:uncharacterized protein LOC126610678 n=1 Tax=Malus sylvestris TaxID=3752 RepID=UPI0021ABC9B3|nr:uncharacterized protein LOC126610678 [Malus sylvestris]